MDWLHPRSQSPVLIVAIVGMVTQGMGGTERGREPNGDVISFSAL